MTERLAIGLMSGTSLDGADAVLARFSVDGSCHVVAHAHAPFTHELRVELAALQAPQGNELQRAWLAANSLAEHYSGLVDKVLAEASIAPSAVTVIGAHGQTVRHQPSQGFTIQLNAPALLTELTAIDVVADFRSRDVAANGQGAPLVPAFHAAVFRDDVEHRVALNLGGISNITDLPPRTGSQAVLGWDCGPGNVLIDGWASKHLGTPFDDRGQWARSGMVIEELLERLLSEPWLQLGPPKSTGRDLFNDGWLDRHLSAGPAAYSPENVQATLTEFTARNVAEGLRRHADGARRVIVCGGGANNAFLVERIGALSADSSGQRRAIEGSAPFGIPADQVEALAFAWLAIQFLDRKPGNLAEVTGARGPRILGALYPR